MRLTCSSDPGESDCWILCVICHKSQNIIPIITTHFTGRELTQTNIELQRLKVTTLQAETRKTKAERKRKRVRETKTDRHRQREKGGGGGEEKKTTILETEE